MPIRFFTGKIIDIKKYKQKLLDELYKPYKNCLQCPLGRQGRKTVIFGEGNPDANLMFIGEGPGRDEDITGRPFIGRSGKLLNKIIEQTNLKREEVFIANVVKCRPPENRKPTPSESKTCKNLLLFKQIKIIKPQVICTLGSSALEALIEKPVIITKLRGKPIPFDQTIILPTFHPAYILRNRKELKKFTDDLLHAKKIIQNQHK